MTRRTSWSSGTGAPQNWAMGVGRGYNFGLIGGVDGWPQWSWIESYDQHSGSQSFPCNLHPLLCHVYENTFSPHPPPTFLHSDIRYIAFKRGCIVLLWTCCPRQYVWCFCLFWLGESRFIRNAVQIPTWNLLSPTLTPPFPLDSVVQLLFY